MSDITTKVKQAIEKYRDWKADRFFLNYYDVDTQDRELFRKVKHPLDIFFVKIYDALTKDEVYGLEYINNYLQAVQTYFDLKTRYKEIPENKLRKTAIINQKVEASKDHWRDSYRSAADEIMDEMDDVTPLGKNLMTDIREAERTAIDEICGEDIELRREVKELYNKYTEDKRPIEKLKHERERRKLAEMEYKGKKIVRIGFF